MKDSPISKEFKIACEIYGRTLGKDVTTKDILVDVLKDELPRDIVLENVDILLDWGIIEYDALETESGRYSLGLKCTDESVGVLYHRYWKNR